MSAVAPVRLSQLATERSANVKQRAPVRSTESGAG
jgi:hypothetical protein